MEAVEKEHQESTEMPDPQAELELVLQEKEKWNEAQRELASEMERIAEAEQDLHYRLATNLVIRLFQNLEAFALLFTEGSVSQKYADIQGIIQKIKAHDSSFPKSLASGEYSEVKADPYFDFWLHNLQKFLVPGEPMHRFLDPAFSKVHGSPFSEE